MVTRHPTSPHPAWSKRTGFTLIELATVVIVMGVIATIAVPRFSSFIAVQRLDAASRRIMVDLARAQRDARFTGTSRTVTFNVAGDRYRLWSLNSIDDPTANYVVLLGDEPYGIDIVSASLGGDMNVIFDGYGVPDSGGTVVIGVGTLQKTITLDAETGRSVGTPTVSNAAN